jgi:lipopolysaccharide export LptBFGC system permease protein LptF
MLVGIVGEALAGFLPWLQTGERQRNGYELIDAARALDVEALEPLLWRSLALAWYLAPLAAAVCCLAALLHARRTAAVLAVVTGLVGAAVALLVELGIPAPARSGVALTLITAVAGLVGGTVELVVARQEGGRRRELAPEPR